MSDVRKKESDYFQKIEVEKHQRFLRTIEEEKQMRKEKMAERQMNLELRFQAAKRGMLRETRLKDTDSGKSPTTVTVYNKDILPEVFYKSLQKRTKKMGKIDFDEVEFPAFPYELWLIIIDYTQSSILLRLEKTCRAMY